MKFASFLMASTLLAGPAFAQEIDDPLAPLDPVPTQPAPTPTPSITLPAPALPVAPPVIVRPVPKDWRGIFSAIDSADWEGARLGIAALPAHPLKPLALAELYTARGSPAVDAASVLSLIAQAPELPQAEQLARLAQTRGAIELPPYFTARRTISLGSAPRRGRTRPVAGEPLADQLRLALEPYVKVDDGTGAEQLMLQSFSSLSLEARAEAAHRVAWMYFIGGRDADARRVADYGRQGATGEWSAQAAWVSGLASWRLNDCNAALTSFRESGRLAREMETQAGAHYWAARAAQACRRPREVAPLLKAATRSQESFYGLMARETLGLDGRLPKPAEVRDLPRVEALPNIVRARELIALGRRAQAEELLRHQAKIGSPSDHRALIRIADRMDLAGAQFWLAHFGQPGASSDPADRYPAPNWTPYNGWRVEPALAYAHIIQESTFRSEAVSPAGAVGLMQVRPGTAGDTARQRGTSISVAGLKDPLANIDYGQAFIELLRRHGATQGQLPKIIAAYNAGPVPVSRWAYYDRGDPLLWMESIPYWETRFYVPTILRNMWVIQGLAGTQTPTLTSLVQHKWPAFPAKSR
ncbi:lytic transglycosylase domain-containing protein [Sphingomonas sp. LY160]|uniref:lytic transglycosylase domain-containing protein n=1 Tax=Sphingomonas sp. LY160 TaxID=3095342 RepID=UPI002ADEF13F|nr:lytic transglycosylase domain-containing protein [Sphingomonas sp. LY160]MEA1071186.1 lytic transglycosylase domain-containing protein [Sphingomonas sp. LY160]